MSLKQEYLSQTDQFLNRYAARMPGSGGDGGATPARGGDFLPVQGVDHMGDAKTFMAGYDIAPKPVEVAWHQVHPAEVKLLVRGTPTAAQYPGVPDDEWFEAYVLPWNQGCSARLKIPRATGVNAFFTAEMNGCCFVVGGSETDPWTAHFNVGDVSNAVNREAKWKSMLGETMKGARFTNIAALRKWDTPGAVAAPGRLDRLGASAPRYQATATEQTDAATAVEREFTAANKKNVGAAPITDLKVATMGLRDPATGRWRFFYQRSVFTQVASVKKKLGRAGGLIKLLNLDKRRAESVNRYMLIDGSQNVALWPNGPGRVNVPVVDDNDLDLGGFF